MRRLPALGVSSICRGLESIDRCAFRVERRADVRPQVAEAELLAGELGRQFTAVATTSPAPVLTRGLGRSVAFRAAMIPAAPFPDFTG